MLTITFPRHGAVLNANHGIENADSLTITVTGTCGSNGIVRVNGIPAGMDGTTFRAEIPLTSRISTITAVVQGCGGEASATVKVIWDKASFKRYNFFIEDNSFFLTELAAQRPKSLFDHFYLAFLREMHRRYGVKMTLKCFFRNAHDPNGFTMESMPDCWKSEFEDNSHWLKLAFHALAEFPDRTYQDTSPENFAADFHKVNSHIRRFAGEKTLTMPTEIHWCMLSPATQMSLPALGIKCLDGHFMRPLPDGSGSFCDLGYFLDRPEAQYLQDNLVWHDFSRNLTYTRSSAVCNLLKLEEIPQAIRRAAEHKTHIISISSHEQYIFPYSHNYQPDHFQRMEAAFKTLTENNITPVFFND
ncbi:MAG: hypothetical protein J6S21_07255, partial [Victivallales bacterium]|nr:hypothetical protein [Victivallales bacterium]